MESVVVAAAASNWAKSEERRRSEAIYEADLSKTNKC